MGHGAIRDQLLERTNGTPLALTLKVKHCATASERLVCGTGHCVGQPQVSLSLLALSR